MTGEEAFRRHLRPVTGILLAAASASLATYAYVGFYTRYMADDYCSAGILAAQGFWGAQAHWYMTWTGRFSYLFAVALTELAGSRVVRFLPVALIAGWLVVATWALAQLLAAIEAPRASATAFPLAALLLFITVDRTPDYVQALSWQTGILTYTAPLVLLTVFVGLCALWYRTQATIRGSVPQLYVMAGLAFLAAGFSETYAVAQGSLIVLGIGVGLSFLPAFSRRAFLAPLLAGLAGTALAFAVMLAAPGNAVRQAHLPLHPAPLPLLVASVRYASEVVAQWALWPPFAAVAAFVGPLVLGFLLRQVSLWRIGRAVAIRWASVAVVAGFLLTVASVAPSIWGYGLLESPPGRIYVIPTFVLTLVCLLSGFLFGAGIIDTKIATAAWNRWMKVLVAALVLATVASVLRPLLFLPTARRYAAEWDQRDVQIRKAAVRGESDLAVPALATIAGLNDVADSPPRDWVNGCIADYYGLKSIRPRAENR